MKLLALRIDSALDRNLRYSIAAIVLLQLFAVAGTAQPAQKATLISARLNAQGLSRQEMRPLMPLIKTQTDNMMKIFAKYDDRVATTSIVQAIDLDIWSDIIKNRQIFFGSAAAKLTKQQSSALRSVFSSLEKETVTMLLDEEIQLLSQDLELSNEQTDSLYQIAMLDIKRKHALINASADYAILSAKLQAVSEQTNLRIEKALFPDQLNTWEKKKQKAKEQASKLVA
ncbi:MAG: hypothetical protein DMF62_10940 [Acidobacteria bacterium]|nr:MAG: hypothetical protein DMF62_10940 [Acidobacteriota bacterium]